MSSLHMLNSLIIVVVLITNLIGGRGSGRKCGGDEGEGGQYNYERDVIECSRSLSLAGDSEEAQARDVLSGLGDDLGESRGAKLRGHHGPRSSMRLREMEKPKCGVKVAAITKRSTNGQYIYDNKQGSDSTYFMAMVRIQLHQDGVIFCSGALISNRHVLTAAHCVSNCIPGDRHLPMNRELVTVSLANKSMRWSGPLRNRVTNVFIHPKFNNCHKDFEHDLAILRLEFSVNYSPRVNRICLPPYDFKLEDSPVAFYGYGYTNVSKELYVPWRRINTYKVSNTTDMADACDPEMFCTSSGEKQSRPCPGDSGGPLVAQRAGGWVLLGINSATNGDYTRHADCDEFVDKIYSRPRFVRVQRWIDWIGATIERT